MEEIIIKEVLTRKQLREFIYLPAAVHRNEPGWLPPVYIDEWGLFNKKKNRSYQYADAVLYLAYRNGKPAGRIMGLINNRYNSIKEERHGRFCFMESFEDRNVIHALLEKVEEWARKKGMEKIVGPLGFSDKDPQGFQIEGFDYPSIITTPTNSPFLPRIIESEGYSKEVDLVNYLIPMPEKLPALYYKAYEKITRNGDFKIIEFNSRRALRKYIIPVLELMNDTFSEIYGFVPLNDSEKEELAARYLPILDPGFVKLVEAKGELIGFVVGMPDISRGIIEAKGKLFPFGLFRILKAMKASKKLTLLLGGVKKSYRGHGIDILMGMKIFNTCIDRKMEAIDSHLILEMNSRMRAECERLNGQIIKRFRIFQKTL